MLSRYGLIAASILISGSIFATPITGRLIMNGISLVGDTTTTIDFNYPGCGSGTPICTSPAASNATTGTFQVGAGSDGSFASYIGTIGSVHSFDSTQAPPGVDLGLGGAIPNFVMIPGIPNIAFSLREVRPGAFSNAQCFSSPVPGQTCTPTFGPVTSPLELSNSSGSTALGDHSGTSAHAQFSVLVYAINLTTNEISEGVGTYSTDFSGYSYQTLLNAALAGDIITTGFHGDFTLVFTAVPEPATGSYAAAGTALLGLGGLIGRWRKRSKLNA